MKLVPNFKAAVEMAAIQLPEELDFPTIDILADELLLRIFSCIEDGKILLDVTPLVSKRWNRVSRDKCAWASVRLQLNSELVPLDICTAARILLHAPSLDFISCDLDQPLRKHDKFLLESAMRRTKAIVRALQFDSIGPVDIDMIRRTGPKLRVLCLQDVHCASKSGNDTLIQQLFEVVSGLDQLEYLNMNIDVTRGFPYGNEFASGLPSLQQLSVNMYVSNGTMPITTALMVDLLRGSASSLRRFCFKFRCFDRPLPALILESVAACVELRSISISLLDLHVVQHLEKLEHMQIYFSDILLFPPLPAISQQIAFLKSCRGLPNVRILEVEMRVENEKSIAMVQQLILRLARAASNITTMKATYSYRSQWKNTKKVFNWNIFCEILACVPHLQILHFNPLPMGFFTHSVALYGLRELRKVSGKVLTSSPGETQKFLYKFKCERPNVLVHVDIESYINE